MSPWLVPTYPLLPALIMIGLMSMAQSHYRTTAGTLIQLNTPDRFRSRVTSLASYGQGFVFPFSILVGILAGFMFDATGSYQMPFLVFTGAATLAAILALFATPPKLSALTQEPAGRTA